MASTLVAAIREEIRRLAKREIRLAFKKTLKGRGAARRTMANLKARMRAAEQQIKILAKRIPQPGPEKVDPREAKKARVTGKGVRALRRKLRLSQAAFGKLLGVSALSVYKWEKREGPIRMRTATRASFLAARSLGAREARQLVAKR